MDEEHPTDAPDGMHSTPVPRPRPRRRRWLYVVIVVVLVVPLLAVGTWTAVALNWSYSSGYRAGYVQKFSKKGWICKTWEGELSMVNLAGAAQERFVFSVRDDSIAQAINRLMGSRVTVNYEEHRGGPGACFGETNYFVTGVSILR
jgi:hypothetical protein